MKILVAGATGRTGQHVVRQLHMAGHTVHAMVRKPEQRDAMASLGAEPVFGDFMKPLGYTLQGCRGAVFVAGARNRADMSEIEMVEHTGAFTFVETCRRLSVRRLVMLSVQGAHDPETVPEQVRGWVRLKADTDQFIRENKLDFTIIRATPMSDGPATGLIRAAPVLPAPEGDIGDLSREDVAKVLSLAVDDRKLFDRSFDIMPGDMPIADAMSQL